MCKILVYKKDLQLQASSNEKEIHFFFCLINTTRHEYICVDFRTIMRDAFFNEDFHDSRINEGIILKATLFFINFLFFTVYFLLSDNNNKNS